MKKSKFFKRRKKVTEKKETKQASNINVAFYSQDIDEVQEYHNPYLTVTEFFEQQTPHKLN